MKTKLILSSLLALHCLSGKAQFQGRVYEEDSSVTVSESGFPKKLAWCGGFNNPQFAVADLNRDGLKDLVVYQADQFSVKTFINFGTPTAPDYRYRPRYARNFPACVYYLILKDYNGDGVEDLFNAGPTGFTAFTGSYNTANELVFSFYKSLYYNNDKKTIGWVNAEVNPGDIPAIVDVDHDGDLDFLSYYGDGYYMNWYQNLQVEKGYPKDSITIRLADRCWGKMVQSTARTHTLGITCDNSALSRTTDEEGSTAKVTDGGNTPCLIDMDDDGDYDVLDGHRAFNYIVYLENGKSLTGLRDSMIYQDTAWRTMGDTVKITQWAAAFHVDVDGDNKRDLLVSPNSPNTSENYRCIQYYKNLGTDKLPSFKYQSDTFLVADALDAGSNSYPFFYDYNRDGKPDLFIGSKGYYDAASGQFLSKVMYLQNTSTPGNPSFQLINRDFLNLSYKKYKGISIGIGDVDNDGKDDFVMGHINGYVDYIKNTAVSKLAIPVWTSAPDTLRDSGGKPIATNGSSVPLIYDMNTDGVNDLVLGDQLGYLIYYQNTSSTPGTSAFVFTNDQFGFLKADPEKTATGFSTPFIGRIDNSSKEYLLLGSRSGRIFRFTGWQGGNIYGAFTRMDSAYSYILADYGTGTSYMSAPAVADIDGDGKYEMVVGNVHGGLLLFKQMKTVSLEKEQVAEKELLLYPNPAKNEIHIGSNQTIFGENTSVYIYNTLGQVVKSQEVSQARGFITVDLSDLPDAVYCCTVYSAGKRFSRLFVKQKN